MLQTLELARKTRDVLYLDAMKRGGMVRSEQEMGQTIDFKNMSSSSQVAQELARFLGVQVKDVLNLLLMIPEVIAIALIDTFTLPIRKKN